MILIFQYSEELQVEDLGENSHSLKPAKSQYDISRYPHFDQIKKDISTVGRSEQIDISAYLQQRKGVANIDEDSTVQSLIDLPDDLQQLQQQLLEVRIFSSSSAFIHYGKCYRI